MNHEFDFELPKIEVGSLLMSQEEGVANAERIRAKAHQIIDQRIDAFIRRLMCGEKANRENIRPLGTNQRELKGSKPTAVYIPGREPVAVKTWQQAAYEILKDCNSDEKRHESLMHLRGKVHGRYRTFIAAAPDGMGKPLKVDDELYVEGNFDTEALLRMLIKDIFPYVDYQWQGILVELRDQSLATKEESTVLKVSQEQKEEIEQTSQAIGPTM